MNAVGNMGDSGRVLVLGGGTVVGEPRPDALTDIDSIIANATRSRPAGEVNPRIRGLVGDTPEVLFNGPDKFSLSATGRPKGDFRPEGGWEPGKDPLWVLNEGKADANLLAKLIPKGCMDTFHPSAEHPFGFSFSFEQDGYQMKVDAVATKDEYGSLAWTSGISRTDVAGNTQYLTIHGTWVAKQNGITTLPVTVGNLSAEGAAAGSDAGIALPGMAFLGLITTGTAALGAKMFGTGTPKSSTDKTTTSTGSKNVQAILTIAAPGLVPALKVADGAAVLYDKSKEDLNLLSATAGAKTEAGIKAGEYGVVLGIFKTISFVGLRTLGARADRYDPKLYGGVTQDLRTDWSNVKADQVTPVSASYTVNADKGTLAIGLHESVPVKLDATAALSNDVFTQGRDRPKFITIGDRPVAMIPSEGKPLSLEVKSALSEAGISVVTDAGQFRKILSQNTIIVGSNGIGNPNTNGTSPDMDNLLGSIRQGLSLNNTVAPSLYNRPESFAKFVNDHPGSEGLLSTIQKIKDVGTDAWEMLSDKSIQRDVVASKLAEGIDTLKESRQLGVSPRVIFIGFSGGGQPSLEVGMYLGPKAGLIGLDSPLAKKEMGSLASFTFIHSSFVGSLYDVNQTPTDTKRIDLPSTSSYISLMNVDNHLGFFSSPETKQQVINEVVLDLQKGIFIRSDELDYRRR